MHSGCFLENERSHYSLIEFSQSSSKLIAKLLHHLECLLFATAHNIGKIRLILHFLFLHYLNRRRLILFLKFLIIIRSTRIIFLRFLNNRSQFCVCFTDLENIAHFIIQMRNIFISLWNYYGIYLNRSIYRQLLLRFSI